MKNVDFGVVVFPGSCDERDAHDAIERIEGARARYLWHNSPDLASVDVVVIPGGFSYGDYLRAGAIARFSPVMNEIAEFALQGRPVLGICNGFQVLCEAGLLPGALLPNPSLRFVCRQVDVVVENSDTPFTRACSAGDRLSLPVKHSVGRYFAPPEGLEELDQDGQVLARYAPGERTSSG
jgi:phosphoribosylformylglycinamidine synthase